MERMIQRVPPAVLQKEPGQKLKKVAAYARVSNGKDAMLHSLSAQISYYSALIQKTPGWEYAGVYADEAISGTKNSRGEFQKMMEVCRGGKIDMILTKSISRFARNTVTTLEAIRELTLLGVDVYFEEQNIHTLGEEGEFILTLLAAYAEEEARSASENIKWKVGVNFRKGRLWSTVIFGYRIRDGRLVIEPLEAQMLRKAAQMYLDGASQRDLKEMFREAGVVGRNGKYMSGVQILNLLCNEKMVGDMLLQKTYVSDPITKKKKKNLGELPQYYVQDSHEGILDRDTQRRILEQRAKRMQETNGGRNTYPFSGRITCSICGKHFVRHPYNKKHEWICRTHLIRGNSWCERMGIPEEMLEKLTAEVMGLPEFDGTLFRAQVKEIMAVENDALEYRFFDGHRITKEWVRSSKGRRREVAK